MDVKKKALVLAGMVTIFGMAVTPARLDAQLQRNRSQSEPEAVLTAPSRELTNLLTEAERNIAEKQWSEATLALGKILGLEQSEDGVVGEYGVDRFYNVSMTELGGNGKQISGSLFQHIYKLLDELPDEAIDILQVRHGVSAKAKLDSAIQASDWETIEQISSHYIFLPVGQDARLLLANKALSEGDATGAAALLERLALQNRAVKRFGAPIGLLAAQATLAGGNRSGATEILIRTLNAFPTYEGTPFGTKTIAWKPNTPRDESVAKLLNELSPVQSADLRSAIVRRITQIPLVAGGDARRNADTAAGLPLPILRWHTELHESNFHKDQLVQKLDQTLTERTDSQIAAIPTRIPISTGRTVICPTYDQRIVAVDLQTGLLQWECVYTGAPLGFALEDAPRFGIIPPDEGQSVPDHLLKRVWGESIYGNISTDGIRLFSISEKPSSEVTNNEEINAAIRFGMPPPIQTSNVLQCWSVVEEGKLLWEVGFKTSGIAPELENAYFLGAPLPYKNQLLIIAELNGEVNLISLAPATGKPNWVQPLLQNADKPIANDSLLKISGATPTADGNIILCPTLSGHLIAFDLHARTLLWGLNYRKRASNAAAMSGAFGGLQLGDYDPFTNRSIDLSSVTTDGLVLYAPPDGYGIHAVDLATGRLKWQKFDNDSNSVRYVGAIYGDTILAVEQNRLNGLNKDTGVEIWPSIQFPENAQVVGRGVRQGKFYFVPLSNRTILKVDLETGATTSSVQLSSMPGNLVNVGDRLLSVSPFQMDCYAIADAFKKRFSTQASQLAENENYETSPSDQKNPEQIQQLIDRGELELLTGNIDRALDLLERANKADPNNRECWVRLKSAAIEAIKTDFSKYQDRVAKYNIDLENDETYLRSLIQLLIDQKHAKKAFENLIRFSDARVQQKRNKPNVNDLIKVNGTHSIQEDRWIQVQLAAVLAIGPELTEDRDYLKLIDRQKELIASIDASQRRLKLDHLRNFPEFNGLRTELAIQLLQAGQLYEAEQLLAQIFGDIPYDQWRKHDEAATVSMLQLSLLSSRFDLFHKIAGTSDKDFEELTQLAFKPNGVLGVLNPNAGLLPNLKEQRALRLRIDESASTPAYIRPTEVLADWPAKQVQVSVQEKNRNETTQGSPGIYKASPIVTVGKSLENIAIDYINPTGELRLSLGDDFQHVLRTQPGLFDGFRGQAETVLVDGTIVLVLPSRLIAFNAWDKGRHPNQGEVWNHAFGGSDSYVTMGRDFGRFPNQRQSLQETTNYYWGIQNRRKNIEIVHATRQEIIVYNAESLIAISPQSGQVLWRVNGLKDAKIGYDNSYLYCLTGAAKVIKLDLHSGRQLSETSIAPAFPFTMAIGDTFLAVDEEQSLIRLVKAEDGSTLLEQKLTADYRLGLSDKRNGLIAIGNTGDYHYWNLRTREAFEHKVELRDGELKQRSPNNRQYTSAKNHISLAEYDDRFLVLPFNSRFTYDNVEVSPRDFDDNFALVSGSVFAISPTDGSPLWKETLPIMQFGFPIAQERRNTPFAIFVRRFNFPRLVENKNFQAVGLGLVDLRTGEVVYEDADAIGAHSASFIQYVHAASRAMTCTYGEVTYSIFFNDDDAEDGKNSLGTESLNVYKEAIKEKVKDQPKSSNVPEKPNTEVLEFLFE